MAHCAGGRHIRNECCFVACACDRLGPDKLWSMRKVWLTFRALSLGGKCISERMIHCNLFSHIYTYINTYIHLHMNKHICIYARNVITVLLIITCTVQLTVNDCLDEIPLGIALKFFNVYFSRLLSISFHKEAHLALTACYPRVNLVRGIVNWSGVLKS